MYETAFDGWTRTPEEIKKCRENKIYRWKLHFSRFKKSVKQNRFNWNDFYGALINRKRDFE